MKFRLLVTAQISLLLVKAIKSRETRQLKTHIQTGNAQIIHPFINIFICAQPFGLINVYHNLISVIDPFEK